MVNKINKKIVVLSICALAIIFLASTVMAWLPLPGTLLLVADNIGKADCIVPLNGEAYFRFRKAVELYNKGYSKKILTSLIDERESVSFDYNFRLRLIQSNDISEREFVLMAFRYFGLDDKDIHFTDKEVTSTYEEAVATKEYMIKNGFKSLIMVTSTYHTRRALLIFNLVFKKTGIKIYNCTVKKDLYNPYRWWLKERDVKAISEEYLSIIYNLFYHFILRKGRTPFDTV